LLAVTKGSIGYQYRSVLDRPEVELDRLAIDVLDDRAFEMDQRRQTIRKNVLNKIRLFRIHQAMLLLGFTHENSFHLATKSKIKLQISKFWNPPLADAS